MHALLAPYALHALEPEEEHEVKRHLAVCSRCRAELDTLQEAAAELAYVVAGPTPPPELRNRIGAGLYPAAVAPLRRPTLAIAAAALAAAAAAIVGLEATSLSHELDRERAARQANARLLAVLSSPDARTVGLEGRSGKLVVTRSGEAALLLPSLPSASRGHVYEAWVVTGGVAVPAGVFERGPVALSRRVPPGSAVAVTVEARDDLDQMTPPIVFRTETV